MLPRVALLTVTIAAVAAAAGCGSSSYGGSSGSTTTASKSSGSGAVVSTRKISGVGTVLVDSAGRTLYSPAQESGGTIHCTGGCVAIWPPLTVTSAKRLNGARVPGKLGTVMRPGGVLQATYRGAPLYSFTVDHAAGSAKGNGTKDSFGGQSFTWHAITTAGAAHAPTTTAPSSSGGSGYGGGGGGGY
jgi:predicted lipoprotein with Yx(FWY)xxD motif